MRRKKLDDVELVRSAQEGEAAAFGELVRRYQDAAFRAAFLVLRDAHEAEDAAQDAFIKAYRAVGRFRTGAGFRPWLLKIVMNESLNRIKSRNRRRAMAERAAAEGETLARGAWTIDDTIIDRERADLLRRAIETLRQEERVIIYLRYFLQLSEQEMAEYIGVAQGTVKSRLHRAVAKLRQVVSRDFPGLMVEGI